jgi:hypothetical protein
MRKFWLLTLLFGIGCSIIHPVSSKAPTPNATTLALDNITVTVTPVSSTIVSSSNSKVAFVGTAKSDTNAKITTWTWTFGDGITCTSPNFCGMSVTHFYPKIGTYVVHFTATDSTGATESATATVNVVASLPSTGPPSYSNAYTGTDIVQTPAAPFNTKIPAGTCVQDTVLSKFRLCRVSDENTMGKDANTQWNSTPSGGSFDRISNTATTAITLKSTWGSNYVSGFNPVTDKAYSGKVITECPDGGAQWSQVNPLIWYCIPGFSNVTPGGTGTGLQIYAVTFSASSTLCGKGQCLDLDNPPVWSKVYDLAQCKFAQPGKPISHTIFSVGLGDKTFSSGISWAGAQDSSHLYFYYEPGIGCTTFDTKGNGTNPIWYGPDGSTNVLTAINATWGMHEATTIGPWVSFSPASCIGTSCNNLGPFFWQPKTANFVIFTPKSNATGHGAMGKSFYFNSGNPSIDEHPYTSLDAFTTIATFDCHPCQENHFSADITSDVNPLLGSSAGPNAVWVGPYKNELYGVTVDGTDKILRFGKCYNSGTPVSNFWAQYCISSPSQDRTKIFFTSDMLCGLGMTPGTPSICRNDDFVLDLTQ